MNPGGHNPRGNAAPFSRYSNGAGFRRGSTGPNAPAPPNRQPAAAPPHVMTPQQRDEVLLRAGRLAAEYLVNVGELPPDALLHGRQPAPPHAPFQGHQHQRPPPPPGHPWHEGPPSRHGFPAPRPSQHGWSTPRPLRKIAKRPVGRSTFQGRGRFPFVPPGASGAAAPEAAGEPSHGQGVAAPGAGGVGGVRGDGFDEPAPAGPSSGRQQSPQPGGAAHGQPKKGQPGEHSNSRGPVGL